MDQQLFLWMECTFSNLPKPPPGVVFIFVTCLALKAFEFPASDLFLFKEICCWKRSAVQYAFWNVARISTRCTLTSQPRHVSADESVNPKVSGQDAGRMALLLLRRGRERGRFGMCLWYETESETSQSLEMLNLQLDKWAWHSGQGPPQFCQF